MKLGISDRHVSIAIAEKVYKVTGQRSRSQRDQIHVYGEVSYISRYNTEDHVFYIAF